VREKEKGKEKEKEIAKMPKIIKDGGIFASS